MQNLPAKVTEAQQTKVLASLDAQVKKLEENVASISKMDKWGKRMNRKTRLGAMDVISKLKNAMPLVKKGALTGNKDASDQLASVLGKMCAMAGQDTPAKQTFLH